jgi:xylan 1,4-beta-xylosidase
MPDSAKFPLYDLRVFGNGVGKNPGRASAVQATRNAADPRVTLRWKPAQGAEFHIVRLGWRPDLMNQNFQVYHGATSLDANSLNLGAGYCAAVDAVNENGIMRATSTSCHELLRLTGPRGLAVAAGFPGKD